MDIQRLRKLLDKTLAERRQCVGRLKSERDALASITTYLVRAEDGQKIAQHVAKQTQQTAHSRIAKIVTQCLKAVFDEPYRFELVFETKRGKTEARPAFFKGKHEIHPADGSGGGVLDVAVLGLRVASVLMARPRLRPLLCLDEPFRNLSSPIYRERIANLIEKLSEELGIQFIIVTQTPELRMGKVIRFKGKKSTKPAMH